MGELEARTKTSFLTFIYYLCIILYIMYFCLFLFYSSFALIYFNVQIVPHLASGSPFKLLLCPLTCPSYSFSLSVLSVTTQCSRLILSFPSSSSPEISQFSKELWALLCRMEFRNQDPVLVVLTILGCDCFQTPQ